MSAEANIYDGYAPFENPELWTEEEEEEEESAYSLPADLLSKWAATTEIRATSSPTAWADEPVEEEDETQDPGTGGQVTEPAGSARQGGRPGWLAASEDPEQTQMLATGSFPRGRSRRWLCYTIAEDQEAEEEAYIEQLIQHPKALMPAGSSLRSLGVTAWEPYSYQREALQKLPQRSPDRIRSEQASFLSSLAEQRAAMQAFLGYHPAQ